MRPEQLQKLVGYELIVGELADQRRVAQASADRQQVRFQLCRTVGNAESGLLLRSGEGEEAAGNV